jgi:hypothetical protein
MLPRGPLQHDQYQVIRQTILLPIVLELTIGFRSPAIIFGEDLQLPLRQELILPSLLETKLSCKVHVLRDIMSLHRKSGVMHLNLLIPHFLAQVDGLMTLLCELP